MITRKKTLTAAVATSIALFIFLTAESCEDPKSAQSSGQAQTEQAFGQQQAAVPYPAEQLKDSQERRNLKERLLRQNKPNAISYLYVLGGTTGKPIGYYVVKGKVSSTQSQMTTDNLVIDRTEGDVVVNAPGDDGSYGANEPGVFFFLTSGVMVQTDQGYIISDQPIAVGEFNLPQLG